MEVRCWGADPTVRAHDWLGSLLKMRRLSTVSVEQVVLHRCVNHGSVA
jgi:hypothetical protein